MRIGRLFALLSLFLSSWAYGAGSHCADLFETQLAIDLADAPLVAFESPRLRTAKRRDFNDSMAKELSNLISKSKRVCLGALGKIGLCRKPTDTPLTDEEVIEAFRKPEPVQMHTREEALQLIPLLETALSKSREGLRLSNPFIRESENEFQGTKLGGPPTTEWMLFLRSGGILRIPVDTFSITEPFRIVDDVDRAVTSEQKSVLMTEVLNYYARTSFDLAVRERAALYARLNEALRQNGYTLYSSQSMGGIRITALASGSYVNVVSHEAGPFHADRNWMTQWSSVPEAMRNVMLDVMPASWFTVSAARRIISTLNAKPHGKYEKEELYSFVDDWLLLPQGLQTMAEQKLSPSQLKSWRKLVAKYRKL